MFGSLWFQYRKLIIISLLLVASMAWHGAVEAASLTLSWGDVSNNEDGFRIERMAADGSFVQIATVGANVTSYTDSNLTSGSTYCYVVRAFNSGGVSDPSNGACATAWDSISSSGSSSGTTSSRSSSSGSGATSSISSMVSSSSSQQVAPVDIGVFRDGMWFILQLLDGGVTAVDWGGATNDVLVPADYDGDGKIDPAVYRDGIWYILQSSDGVLTSVGLGAASGDVPVPADYDGDGKVDEAVYRNGLWFILRSSDGVLTSVGLGGESTDVPLN